MKRPIALITGGAKGIGASIVKQLCKNNFDIILHYNKSNLIAKKLKKDLECKYKNNIYLIAGDLNKESDIDYIINYVKGITNKLDVLINNAALSLDNDIEEKTKEEFMNVLSVNLVAPFLLTRGLSSLLVDGTVINIASTDGIDTYSTYNVDYSTSKAGLILLTKILSEKYSNIYFVVLAPNWVKTESIMEMEPTFLENELKRVNQKKLLLPEDISLKVIEIINNKNVQSGSLIRIDGEKYE